MNPNEARDEMIRKMRLDEKMEVETQETPAEARERMLARMRGDEWEESSHPRIKKGEKGAGQFTKNGEGGGAAAPNEGGAQGSEGSKESGRGLNKTTSANKPESRSGASKSSKSECGESARSRSNHARQAKSAKPVRPIDTPEGQALYDAIKNGMSIKDIKKSPLIRRAHARALYQRKHQTNKIDTPEREELRNQVANDQFNAGSFSGKDKDGNEVFDGKVDKGFRAEIVIGPPASGKSSVICNKVSKDTHSRILDSDEIKKGLPEFNDGKGAGRVHEESSDILNQRVLPQLYKGGAHCGENVVIPIVGSNSKKALHYLKMLKEAGYEVHLSFNDVEPDKFFKRAMLRYLKTGRYIDYKYLESIGHSCQDVFKELEEMGGFDSYEKYDNNAERSENPTKKRR